MPRKKNKFAMEETMAAWTFLIPNLIGFLGISLIPIVSSLFIAFTDWKIMRKPKFIGFGNFVEMFTSDIKFVPVMRNTLEYMFFTVPVGLVLALVIGTLLDQKIRRRSLYRVLIFIPTICSTISAALLWKWLYAKDIGLIAFIMKSIFGITAPDFVMDPDWAMFAVILFSVWRGLGYNTVIFLAGLQSIDPSFYEAARVDGASPIQSFFRITVPMMTPTTFFVLIMSVIGSFQVFDQTYVLTQGGPATRTTTIVYYIYQNGFLWYRMGYASALAWVLLLIILSITAIQWKMQDRWVNYD
jgi:multiple sugar transport system permease protein